MPSARRKSEPSSRPALDINQRYTVLEAASLLRQARSTVFLDIAAGKLKVIREGRRIFVPGSEIARRSTLPAQ